MIVPLPNLDATRALATRFAPLLAPGFCLALYGDLGAGKTAFTRALLHAAGYAGDVPSPTFTLLQTYDIDGLQVAHFDLYRLKSSDELDELGWDDALADGAVIVEWPERADRRLPEKRTEMHFSILSNGLRICKIQEVS